MFLMKKILTLALGVGLICICSNGFADDLRKKVVGRWYNPYTYASSGEMKGFQFKKMVNVRHWVFKDLICIDGL